MNPLLGVIFHWIGGLAAGSFYAPYRAVRSWSWETYWLAGGLFSWIVAPWIVALLMVPSTVHALSTAGVGAMAWPYLFGILWGVGGLTFGLTMRYLGMSLGMAVALGYCAIFGTLVPPVFDGTFLTEVVGTRSGMVILLGIAVCVAGIAVTGLAGMSKERELSAEDKAASIREFRFRKGLIVATVAGIMSSCFAFGLAAGAKIKECAAAAGGDALWHGLPVLVVVMAGGFTTNFVWCLALNIRHRSGGEYLGRAAAGPMPAPAVLRNWLLCVLGGTIWYFQFFFYSMGESQMGEYGFSSWTMHMASIILFSTLWGIGLKEWKGTGGRTRRLLATGLFLLILSTVIVGYGNQLATLHPAH